MTFPSLITPAERRRIRLLGIGAAVLVAEAVWLLAELVLGIRLQAPAGTAYPEPVDIGPLNVALASAPLSSARCTAPRRVAGHTLLSSRQP